MLLQYRTDSFLLILCCVALASGTSVSAGSLRAGAARVAITPEIGGDIVGGFLPVRATELHDPLHVRCLVLDDGINRLAIVVCDLLGMHRSLGDSARRRIEKEIGIAKEAVMISCTHTHSATSVLGNRFETEQELDAYQTTVADAIVEGVRQAVLTSQPAQLGFTTIQRPDHVFNRRWFLKPGSMPPNPFGEIDMVKMNPSAGSADLIEPAGPTDPTVSILAVRQPDGRMISVFASYSLHYVGGVGNGHISSDYFGMFCDELVRLAGDRNASMVPMLANGTSGDINNINFRTPRSGQKPYEQMQLVAHDVASGVFAAMATLNYSGDLSLGFRYREEPISLRMPTPEQIQWATSTLASPAPSAGTTDLPRIYAERTLRLAEQAKSSPIIRLPLQVLRIGDIGIGTMPCEVFCEIGLEFKRTSKLQPAILLSLAHGYFGYLPSVRHHRLGGYETWLGTNRLEPTASVTMLESLLQMSDELALEATEKETIAPATTK